MISIASSSGSAAALAFLLAVATGVWLSHTGRPLSAALLAVHKLLAVGTVILALRAVYPFHVNAVAAALGPAALVIAVLLVVSLFASGAVLSGAKPVRTAVLSLHEVAALLAAVLAVLATYLFALPAL